MPEWAGKVKKKKKKTDFVLDNHWYGWLFLEVPLMNYIGS